jgi:hypothetical protein
MAYLTKVYLLCLLSVCVVVFSRTDGLPLCEGGDFQH